MKYLNELDPVMSALTYRVSQLERRINDEILPAVKEMTSALATMRQNTAVARMELKRRNLQEAEVLAGSILSWQDIAVPAELKIAKSKIGKGQRRGSGRNRTAAVVAKRWALWKMQRAQGYTMRLRKIRDGYGEKRGHAVDTKRKPKPERNKKQ
jgi:hypothetical protein